MTNWLPSLEQHAGARYLAIADALAEDVGAGRLKPGDRLPTHRNLSWDLGVTVGTVSRAYAEAERRGLIRGEVGRGTYVRTPVQAEAHMLLPEERPESRIINLSFAFPPPGGEARFLAAALESLARDPQAARLLDYQPHSGMLRHRAVGAQWLARSGLDVEPERVVLTSGAQHGIAVCFAAVSRPGDRILTESMTYSGIQALARLFGLRLDGLPSDHDGLLPEAFEAACQHSDAKALYCVPSLHNPTTVTMPDERRRAIAEIARRHQVAIIEDDIFGLLLDSQPVPISYHAPELCYFVTSLSKTLAPGLRVGYVAGPATATERLASAVRATCWMAVPLTAEIATRWILDGTADQILDGHRRETEARRALALEILEGARFDCPQGSLYLWLHLPEPWRSADFALETQRRGVAVTPSQACTIGPREEPAAVRVCLGATKDRAELETGLRILKQVLAAGPASSFVSVV